MRTKKPRFEHFYLSNGIEVLAYPVSEVRAVSVEMGIPAGSAIEDKDKIGTLHFLEHMMLRGSKKYPTPRDIAVRAEELGVSMNAGVGALSTSFYFIAPDNDLESVLEFIIENLARPLFTEDSVKNSISVIRTEQRNFWDVPENKFFQHKLEKMMGESHPYARRGFGDSEVVEKMTLEEVKKAYNRYYIPKNFKLSMAGNYDKEKLKSLLEGTIGSWRKEGESTQDFIPPKTKQNNYFYIYHKKRSQVIFSISFPLEGYKEYSLEERIKVGIFNFLLGGSFSSELYQKLREELGLVYSVGSGNNMWPYTGYLEINGTVDMENLSDALKAVVGVLETIKEKGFENKDFTRAVNYLSTQSLIRFSGVENISSYFLDYLLDGLELLLPEDYIEVAKAITLKDINKLSAEVLDFSKTKMAFMGDKKAIEESEARKIYEKLLKAE